MCCAAFSFPINTGSAFTLKFSFIFFPAHAPHPPPPPLLSGKTKKCLGASVLWDPRAAAAEGQDERWWAAGEDEEAPEGPRPPAQTHPESRRPSSLSIIARLVLLLVTPAFSRLGISMLLEQCHTLSCMTSTKTRVLISGSHACHLLGAVCLFLAASMR